jgi:hypothetical protein
MTLDFQTSNLSKIKPKLRTSGAVSGNFGRAKSKAGSPLRDIGNTNAQVVNVTTQDEYLERLISAYHKSIDIKLKTFIYQEIRKIKVQRGIW